MNSSIENLGLGTQYRRVYEAVNYRLRTFAGSRWADHCRPTNIAILMTNICNAKCVHCDIWKNKGKDDSPTVEEYKKTLAELRSWLGPVHVYFTGGEALIRPYTPELLAYTSDIGLWAEILTHGYWEDQAKIEKLALANPGRITVSLDGIGEAHTIVRGRVKFWERTSRSLETLRRVRAEKGSRFVIRLKTVIMQQNLHDIHSVARYAKEHGDEVFYQAVEQNYNTPEDTRWFETSENWPRDTEAAVSAVEKLLAMKAEGYPIRNSIAQLEAMIPYFRDPDSMRVSIQQHVAQEGTHVCSALNMLQIMPNGDAISCYGMTPIGNIKERSIREIWNGRPKWWRNGCCHQERCTDAEKARLGLIEIESLAAK